MSAGSLRKPGARSMPGCCRAMWLGLLMSLSGASQVASAAQTLPESEPQQKADKKPELEPEMGPEEGDEVQEADAERPGLIMSMGNFIDEKHSQATTGFRGLVRGMDGWLGKEVEDTLENDSSLRLRMTMNRPGDGDSEIKAKVKIRLTLPRTEQRFRILLSVDDDSDENVSVSDIAIEEASGTSRDNRSASLALRFLRTARENTQRSFDLGVRSRRSDVQLFGRLRLGYRRELNQNWDFRARNSLYYYSRAGYDNQLTFDFSHPLFGRKTVFLNTTTAFRWLKGGKGANIGETLGAYYQVDKKTTMALEALAGFDTALNDGATDRYTGSEFRVRFRKQVWRPWVHLELWSGLAYAAANNYQKSVTGLLRLDIELGGSD